jgi:hypothetical protein
MCRLVLIEHRRVDPLDVDSPVLDGLERLSKLEELTRRGFGIPEDAAGDEFHRPQISLWRGCNAAIVSHSTGQDSSSLLPRFSLDWLRRGWGISLSNQFSRMGR